MLNNDFNYSVLIKTEDNEIAIRSNNPVHCVELIKAYIELANYSTVNCSIDFSDNLTGEVYFYFVKTVKDGNAEIESYETEFYSFLK